VRGGVVARLADESPHTLGWRRCLRQTIEPPGIQELAGSGRKVEVENPGEEEEQRIASRKDAA
jgi:hypothetical protein